MGRSRGTSGAALHPEPITCVGRYRIVRRLGMGAGTEVLLASIDGPFELERAVVVKRLLPSADELRPRLFAREAVAYAKLSHPAIVRLYDVVVERGELALVLEWVDGCSLGRLLQALRERGVRLPDVAAAWVAMRLFSALDAAHAVPVIHRDVTPANILVPWDGYAKLADFGLAKVAGLPSDTHLGLVKGTYGYMAQEQVLGDAVTPRTDVYQAALVTYELFRGSPAFLRDLVPDFELLHAMADGWVVPIELVRGDLPPRLVSGLRTALRPSARERAITAGEMVTLLRSAFDMAAGRHALVETIANLGIARDQATFVQPPSTPSREIGAHRMQLLRSMRPPPLAPTEPTPKQAPVSMTVRTAAGLGPERASVARHDSSPTIRPVLTPHGEIVPFPQPPAPLIPPPPGLPDFDDSVAGELPADLVPLVRPAPPPLRFSWVLLVIVFAVLAMAAMAWATFAVARASRESTIVHTMRPRPHHVGPRFRVARRAPAPAPAPSPAPASAPPSKTGLLKMPASTSANRVWIDGKLVGNGGNDREVACGRHTVKIGSRGREQIVDVPCGGDVALTR